jgi:G:T-mismatch repair DNA endonuclease (very short patch repair protein)
MLARLMDDDVPKLADGQDKFKYLDYDKNNKPMKILCRKHGYEFGDMTWQNHSRVWSGCIRCTGKNGANKSKDTAMWIVEAMLATPEGRSYNFDMVYILPFTIAEQKLGVPPGKIVVSSTTDKFRPYCNVCKGVFKNATTFESLHRGHGCNECGSKKQGHGRGGKVSTKDNNLVSCKNADYSAFVKEWSSKNGTISPSSVTPGSHKEVWWTCLKNLGHPDYKLGISARTHGNRGCPMCSVRHLTADKSCSSVPDLVKWWHPANSKRPEECSRSGTYRALLICDCAERHVFDMRVNNFYGGERCPIKAGKHMDKSTSFAKNVEDVALFWVDDGSNILPATQINYASELPCHFRCPTCSLEWKAPPAHYVCSKRVTCEQCTPPPPPADCDITDLVVRKGGVSAASIEWMCSISADIHHGAYKKEYRLPDLGFQVDGYLEEDGKKTVFEFHGSFWHGDPVNYPPDRVHPYKKPKTFGQLYEETLARDNKIRAAGYELVVMWESAFCLQQSGTREERIIRASQAAIKKPVKVVDPITDSSEHVDNSVPYASSFPVPEAVVPDPAIVPHIQSDKPKKVPQRRMGKKTFYELAPSYCVERGGLYVFDDDSTLPRFSFSGATWTNNTTSIPIKCLMHGTTFDQTWKSFCVDGPKCSGCSGKEAFDLGTYLSRASALHGTTFTLADGAEKPTCASQATQFICGTCNGVFKNNLWRMTNADTISGCSHCGVARRGRQRPK